MVAEVTIQKEEEDPDTGSSSSSSRYVWVAPGDC